MSFNSLNHSNSDNCRIFVLHKDKTQRIDIPKVTRICEPFGVLTKPVHQPKGTVNCCFVEYAERASAERAIEEVKRQGYAAFWAIQKNNQDGVASGGGGGGNAQRTNVPQRFLEEQQGAVRANGVVHPSLGNMSLFSLVRTCARCHRPGEYNCERCMDSYCSVECQQLHWPTHKKECIPMPGLIKVGGGSVLSSAMPQAVRATPMSVHQRPLKERNNQPRRSRSPEKMRRKELRRKQQQQRPAKKQQQPAGATAAATKQQEPTLFATEPPKSGELVKITAVVSTNAVWLRSCEPKQSQLYIDQVNNINQAAALSTPLKELPVKGQILLSEYEGDYYRAIVNDPRSEDDIVVAFLEFGNLTSKKLSDLRTLKDEFQRLPRYVHRFILRGVDFAKDGHEGARAYLKNLEDEMTELEVIYNGSWTRHKPVDLQIAGTNESVNEKLQQLMAPKTNGVDGGAKKDEILTEKNLVRTSLNSEEPTTFLVTDNGNIDYGLLSIVRVCDKSLWNTINEAVISYAKDSNLNNGEEYRPKEHELCLVNVASMWYRAICDSIEGKKVTVRLLEEGTIDEVPFTHIRRCPRDLLHPCVTGLVKIEGISINTDDDDKTPGNLIERLEEIFLIQSEHQAEKIVRDDDDDDTYVIYMPEVVEKLRKEGLI